MKLRWLPIAAWVISWITLCLVIIINAAGTSVIEKQVDSVMLGDISILSFIVTYKDIVQDGQRAFRWDMYLNAACSRPVEPTDEEMGPYCTSTSPGYVFDLHSLLVATDYGVEELWLDTLNITGPSEASRNVRLNQIRTVVPFIFYTMGAIDLAVFLLVSIRTSAGERHSNELSLAAVGGAFLAILTASAMLTSCAIDAKHQLQSATNIPYIENPTIPSAWLGLTWAATATSFLATFLVFLEWECERFTPRGERVSRKWKPRDASWFWKRRRHSFERPAGNVSARPTIYRSYPPGIRASGRGMR